MTLTEFLLARIAEDKAWAQHMLGLLPNGREMGMGPVEPKRVLAECEAKRRIVGAIYEAHPRNPSRTVGGVLAGTTLAELALPYADHPDYRDEWKP